MESLTSCLQKAPLSELHLGFNRFQKFDLLRDLGQCLMETSIMILNLEHNAIDDQGIEILGNNIFL